jgi:hypothetical protein
MTNSVRLKETASRAFAAYNATGPNPGLSHDGKPVPGWDEIAPEKRAQIHAKWSAATSAVAKEIIEFIIERIKSGAGWLEAEEEARMIFTLDGGIFERPAITFSGDSG